MPTQQQLIEQAIATGQTVTGVPTGTPDYQHVYYETNGQPYYKTVGGGKSYIPPASAMSMFSEPKALAWAARPENGGFSIDGGLEGLQNNQSTVDANGLYHAAPNITHGAAPETGFWGTDPTWDSTSGQYEHGFNWEHLLDIGIAGGMAAPFVAGAVGAGSAGIDYGIGATVPEAGGTIGGIASGAPAVGIAGVGGGAPILAPTAAAGGGGGAGIAGTIARGALGMPTGGSMGAWDWVGPAIQVGTQIWGANQQANAAENMSAAQTQAAKYAADLQAKSQQAALDFARQQAEGDWRNQEVARQGNYGQWAAREGRISDFGRTVGLPGRQTPGYVAGIDPGYGGGSATIGSMAHGSQSAPSGPLPQIDLTKPIGPQAEAYIRSRGATPNPTSGSYWQSKFPELIARGQELGNPNYALERLAMADEFGGQSAPAAASGSSAPRFHPMDGAAAVSPYMQYQIAPSLQMPGTIAGVLR